MPTPPQGGFRQEGRGFFRYERYFGIAIPALAPLFAVTLLARADRLQGLPLAVQVVLVALAFVGGLVPVALVFTPRLREYWLKVNLYRPGRWWGVLLPALNTSWLCVIVPAWGFALVSGLLYLHGVATTHPQHALDEPFADSWRIYVWTFLSALEIPQTIGWELRFRFTDHVNPVLILLYKVCVIGPVIEIGRQFWKDRRRVTAS